MFGSINRKVYSQETLRHLRYPRPKWWPVKIDRLSNFDKVSFRAGLTWTPVNYTNVFLLPSRLK